MALVWKSSNTIPVGDRQTSQEEGGQAQAQKAPLTPPSFLRPILCAPVQTSLGSSELDPVARAGVIDIAPDRSVKTFKRMPLLHGLHRSILVWTTWQKPRCNVESSTVRRLCSSVVVAHAQ